jgi:hypothetical protein
MKGNNLWMPQFDEALAPSSPKIYLARAAQIVENKIKIDKLTPGKLYHAKSVDVLESVSYFDARENYPAEDFEAEIFNILEVVHTSEVMFLLLDKKIQEHSFISGTVSVGNILMIGEQKVYRLCFDTTCEYEIAELDAELGRIEL